MSYAQRPQGDYKTYGYAGDPGFLSSLWKGIKKIAVPIVGGLIGGPIGAAVGGMLGGQTSVPSRPWQAKSYPGPAWPAPRTAMPGGAYTAFGPRAPGWVPPTTTGMPEYAGAGGACPTGYHLAKDGSGRMVRNRRMNIANPRALRRAMRRVQGFEKLAKRTITFTRRTKLKKRSS